MIDDRLAHKEAGTTGKPAKHVHSSCKEFLPADTLRALAGRTHEFSTSGTSHDMSAAVDGSAAGAANGSDLSSNDSDSNDSNDSEVVDPPAAAAEPEENVHLEASKLTIATSIQIIHHYLKFLGSITAEDE